MSKFPITGDDIQIVAQACFALEEKLPLWALADTTGARLSDEQWARRELYRIRTKLNDLACHIRRLERK